MAITLTEARALVQFAFRADFRSIAKVIKGMVEGDFLPATITATAAQINAAAGGTMAPVLITDVAAYTVLAADSGKDHIIPELAANCTFTLPTGAAGLKFPFMSNGVAAEAQNWIFTAPAGIFYRGGVAWNDLNGGPAADEIGVVYPNGSSHVTLTVVTPAAGTELVFVWDGTRYVVKGTVVSDTTPAFS